MQISPSKEEFVRLGRPGSLVPVTAEILADRITPVSAYERLVAAEGGDEPWAFLLESVTGGEQLARYTFLGVSPTCIYRCRAGSWSIRNCGEDTVGVLGAGEDPLTPLKKLMQARQYVGRADLPRFCGGAVGFLSYDAVRYFEELPDSNPDDLQTDDACFFITDRLVIFDHVRRRMVLLCNAQVEDDPGEAWEAAAAGIAQLAAALKRPAPASEAQAPDASAVTPSPHSSIERYKEAVARCVEYILAGDAFQIVLSERFTVELNCRPFDVYRALRSVNPSPYMYYLQMGPDRMVGSSPEILVTVNGSEVCVRPIAGTRWRGQTPEEDEELERELLADTKEQAEHVMLVDLGRNDIGRVCDYGSVRVDQLMTVERYSHVMHIVSNVLGHLRHDCDLFDVLRACFPAGTVSGAPKVRAMEIIDELETVRRGFYAGCVGYIGFDGGMDMAITIRTLWARGNTATLQAGSGIVADSTPEYEYQECLNKAGALVRAIEMARAGLD